MFLNMVVGAFFLIAAYFVIVRSVRYSGERQWWFWAQLVAGMLLIHIGLCWLIPFYADAFHGLLQELGFVPETPDLGD